MLADAVDGVLSAEDQQFFDAHIASCGPCEQLLAEARRGAAWLEMLRMPAPEPPPALLEKILAQTADAHVAALHPVSLAHPAPAMASGYANVLPFPRRAASAVLGSAFGRIAFEPRLAMTAAMAFLSIALTMDLMGVNPMDLRARDVSPSGLHRSFAELNARAVQYYEGLRVVYELESRVHEFQNVQDNARDAGPAQGQQPASVTDQAQPAGARPDDETGQPAQPESDNPDTSSPQAAPEQQQPEGSTPTQPKAAPSGGVSRREGTRREEARGTLVGFSRNKSESRIAISDAALMDAAGSAQGGSEADIEAYLGGISSVARMAPLREHADPAAPRRAA
jgi:hypothetical protein